MNKAIKYRIYPTTKQIDIINKTFGCCRKVWNLMLSEKIDYYNEHKKSLSVTPAKYKKEYPYLAEVDSLALTNTQINQQKAFSRFFSKKGGFPKYKSAKKSRRSYTTNCQFGKVNKQGKQSVSIELSDGRIKLPILKWVKAKLHRLPQEDWIIKSATISEDCDGKYYCSVLFEYNEVGNEVNVSKTRVIGLDYSASLLYVDEYGSSPEFSKCYKETHKRLAREQKRLSRKIGSRKGESKSRNWIKQYNKVNKVHKNISNQRKDSLHKISTEIANLYDVVGIEDLSIKEQIQGRKHKGFRVSTLDNGWNKFVNMLSYKLEDRGKLLVVVDKWFPSSKKCHCCGYINKDIVDDSIRKWKCPMCNATHDRDVNAAINISTETKRIVFGN